MAPSPQAAPLAGAPSPVRSWPDPDLAYLPCELCGVSNGEVLLHRTDTLTKRREATFTQCRTCGLVYRNPRPWSFLSVSTLTPAGSLVGRKRALKRAARRWFRALQGRNRALLVVGCASGDLLRLILRKGDRPVGIDPDPTAVEEGLGRIDNKPPILRKAVEDTRLPEEGFDGAAAVDSLACLPNPAQTLVEIHRVLKPGGILLVSAANIQAYAFRLFGDAWEPFAPAQTLFHFSPKTLTVLVEEAGFRVRALRHVPDGASWLVAVSRILDRSGWTRLARWLGAGNPACRLLAGAAALLAALLGRGDRLVLIAEKR